MTAPRIDTHEAVAFEELKPLADAEPPCITAVVPMPDPAQVDTQLKNAYRGILRQLAGKATSSETTSELIAPIRNLLVTAKDDRLWAHTLIVFRSAGLFRYYLLHGQFDQAQMVKQRFQVRPVLRTFARESRFHLLALSRQNVRLLHCSQHRFEPAIDGETIPQDRERQDRDLVQFFKDVDKAVTAHLRQDTGPLLLAGVERDVAIYRRVNSYSRTIETAVNGSPDGMTDRALHERAMEVMTSVLSEPLMKAMADVREHAGTPRCSSDPRTIVQAAFQGRVLDLLIAANAAYWGAWNDETQVVSPVPREELLNAAALQTIGHDGRAFVVDDSDMPVKAPVIALLRY